MVLSCYLDDSRGDRRSAIAGYLAPLDVWDGFFVPVWRKLLDSSPHPISEYKASACRGMKKEFSAENGWTEQEASDFCIRVAQTLADADRVPELYGFGTAMIVPAFDDKKQQAVWENAALIYCFSTILVNVLKLAQYSIPHVTEIQFVCDHQPGLEGKLADGFAAARELVVKDCHFELTGLDFRCSHKVLPLQAADIIANETRRDIIKRLAQPQRIRSRALHCLMRKRPHIGFYIDPSVMQDVQRLVGFPPLLYASGGIVEAMPWATGFRPTTPEPILPEDEEVDTSFRAYKDSLKHGT